MWIRWTTPDGPREHCPDYFVRLDDGHAVLMDVKPGDSDQGRRQKTVRHDSGVRR
ncbi:hypothetical protein JM654_07755 [Microbacterium oxydans]|nr:hypothetical protein [Microbacterium oxydans]